jgi:hypothetical protein
MRYVAGLFAIISLAFTPTSSVTYSDVRGSAEGDNIVIQWSTSQEDGVKAFVVEKSSQVDNQFYPIGTVNPTGSGSVYQFTDKGIYKTTSSSIFIYMVRADGFDGSSTYSAQITVPFTYQSSISGVAKRTWGSIKAMFR